MEQISSSHPYESFGRHPCRSVYFNTFLLKISFVRIPNASTISEPSINNWCFTFTGKEKDEETGYGYFGARYMDHELMTMWLSVDPMADKYPGISPYAYCTWNPVKLVDPDGREVINAHTKKVGELQKKIENLQNQINNCNDKKQLRSLNKKLKESQSSLKKEIEYEKLVNNAIQDLKDYGGDEYNQLDNLKNINGENVDVYIQMKSDIGGVDNPKCGLTEMTLSSDGNCRSEKGANTVVISLSYKFRSVLGKTLAHEGGHTIHDVINPNAVFRFLLEHPTAKQDGHDQGNPSGLFANQCENEYCQRKKR